MRITDEACLKFKKLVSEHDGRELSLDEAREVLTRMMLMFERFAAWIATEKAAGRVFSAEE